MPAFRQISREIAEGTMPEMSPGSNASTPMTSIQSQTATVGRPSLVMTRPSSLDGNSTSEGFSGWRKSVE